MSQAVVRLGDVLEVQNGYAFSSDFFATEAPIGLIRIRDLKRGTSTEIGYVGDYDDDYVVKAGDLLVGMDGEFRCYRWGGAPALLNQRVCRLRNFDSRLEPGYLLYSLDFFLKKIEDETGYVTVKHLSSKTITNIEMALPTVAEQRRIVALLDEATQHIADLESAYAQTEMKYVELSSSALESALASVAGDRRVRLGDACEIRNGATPKTGTKAYWDGPHQWLTPAEMGGLSSPVIMSTRRTLSDAGLASCSASLSPPNSVILSCRAPIGHLAINAVPMATNQGCKTLIPGSDLDFRYLYYCLLVRRRMLDELGTGATFRELSAGKLREVEIPVPSLDDQTRVVGLLDQLTDGIALGRSSAQARLDRARALRQSVLETAFRGEL